MLPLPCFLCNANLKSVAKFSLRALFPKQDLLTGVRNSCVEVASFRRPASVAASRTGLDLLIAKFGEIDEVIAGHLVNQSISEYYFSQPIGVNCRQEPIAGKLFLNPIAEIYV